jgi:diadenosine tetraphosphate (Ap4A) HIT family hydrolase
MPIPDPQTAGCVFCAIVSGAAPATFLHEDDLVVALMDIRPVQPGHLLVLPPGYGTQPERSELERLAREIRPDGPSMNLPGAGGD